MATTAEPDFALLHGNTTKWTLEDDSNLVKILSQISDSVILQTKALQDDVEKLTYDANAAEVHLGNVFSSFLQIANTQFVENRVYEIEANAEDNNVEGGGNKDNNNGTPNGTDVDPTANDPTKVLDRYKSALSLGTRALKLFSLFDAEGDDIYNEKPLPFVIGTKEFEEDPLVGLGDIGSGSELDDDGEESEGEEDEEDEEIERYSDEDEEEYMKRRRESRMSRRRSSVKNDGSDFDESGEDNDEGPGYDLVSEDDNSGSDMFADSNAEDDDEDEDDDDFGNSDDDNLGRHRKSSRVPRRRASSAEGSDDDDFGDDS